MAIIIDEKACAAIARRRVSGRDTTLFLRVEKIPGGRGSVMGISDLVVGWAPPHLPNLSLTVRHAADVVVYMDRRVARYSAWNDITVSAWRLGPFGHLMIDPNVMLEMQYWERTHPVAEPTTA